MAMATADPTNSKLLIVGPGVLGSLVGKLWKQQFPQSTVIAQTKTDQKHERLKQLGFQPRVREDAPEGEKVPFVLFSAPSYGGMEFTDEVQAAVDRWDGTGSMVYTSSIGVYAVDDMNTMTESSDIQPPGTNERMDKLLKAEENTLMGGGNVLRLAGLYHTQRGAHQVFYAKQELERWGGYTVNLIHYEDAAGLAVQILKGVGLPEGMYYSGQVFLGADNQPVTFEAMMKQAQQCEYFPKPVKFTLQEPNGRVGKIADSRKTLTQLEYTLKYPSFDACMAGLYKEDIYLGELKQS